MAERTGIAWTDHTHNEWEGCFKISPACASCYASVSTPVRVLRAKGLEVWGPAKTTPRHRTSEGNRRKPFAWDRAAKAEGVRRRVFCSSLSDVFEDHPMLDAWRADLWRTIEACDGLDWQLLTKRPQNILRMVPPSWRTAWPAHVWIGTTVEDQRRAEERIPHLLSVPAAVRFLSCEPLLERVDLNPPTCPNCEGHEAEVGDDGATPFCPEHFEEMGFNAWLNACASATQPGINWVIVGGESGPGARPFDLAWARSILRQCAEAGVPAFCKQVGAVPVDSARAAVHQPCIHEGRPAIRSTVYRADAPEVAQARADIALGTLRLAAPQVEHPLHLRSHFRYTDKAGAAPSEWPADLRVQQFPGEVSRG